jgi:secondary thiamine-phosphate synthase enzyme
LIKQVPITLSPLPRGFHLITNDILNQLSELPLAGILHLFIKHTSAGITINENADPSVRVDLNEYFNRLVQEHQPWVEHTTEGSDDMPAHIKASIVGYSLSIPITNGRLNLGTWQGIYLCEFRNNGGSRKLLATIIS